MKKRLLFLTVKFDTGGTEKVTYDIITRLNPEKYDITLMSMYGGGHYWDHLPDYIQKKCFFPKFIRFVIRYVTLMPAKLVYRTFIREKYDVEIACGDDIPSRVINHSTNKKSKKISWIHMDVVERGYQGYEMKTEYGRTRFYNHFDHIVNVSRQCESKFIEKFGADLPTCVIYNPVPAEEIRLKCLAKPEINLPDNCFNIVCMGRLTPQKGFDRLFESLKTLNEEGISGYRVTILGEGYQRDFLRQLIDEYELKACVEMPGHVENPYAIINQADLFLLSSRDESFSLAVAEAMVLGIPVLSTRCTGPVELLKDGDAGYLVDNDTAGITNGLRHILQDKSAYRRMVEIAQNNTNNFNINDQISSVERLLDNDGELNGVKYYRTDL